MYTDRDRTIVTPRGVDLPVAMSCDAARDVGQLDEGACDKRSSEEKRTKLRTRFSREILEALHRS